MHRSSKGLGLLISCLLLTSWSLAQDKPAAPKRKPGQVPEQVSPEGAAYLERLMKTSLLINGFPPLPSGNLIARAINSQDAKKNEGNLIETNLVIFGGGGNMIWNRFTGPGRVGIQSMYLHMPTSE